MKSFLFRPWVTIALIMVLFIGSSIYVAIVPTQGPPEFEKKATIARQELDAVSFGTILKEETIYQHGRQNRPVVCIRISYSTPEKSGNGRLCEKSYAQYVGFNELSDMTLNALHHTMTNRKWHISQSEHQSAAEALIEDEEAILHRTDRPYNLTYTNDDGLDAAIIFTTTHPSSSCGEGTLCKVAQSNQAKPYRYIAEILVGYRTQPF